MFTPGGRLGGGANAIVFIVVIGLLAAMAIPAFQKVRQVSQLKVCQNNLRALSAAADQYTLVNTHPPRQIADLVGPGKDIRFVACPVGGTYQLRQDQSTHETVVVCSRHGTMEDIAGQFQSSPHRQ